MNPNALRVNDLVTDGAPPEPGATPAPVPLGRVLELGQTDGVRVLWYLHPPREEWVGRAFLRRAVVTESAPAPHAKE